VFRKYFVHSQERGSPHSVVGLLFSFQRPSETPGREIFRSHVPALTASESRGQPISSRGEAFTSTSRCRQVDQPTRVRLTTWRRQGPLI
jgi:hypothetical protein